MSLELDEIGKAAEKFTVLLGKFERALPRFEERRKGIIKRQLESGDEVENTTVRDDALKRARCMKSIEKLETALQNSKKSFERFSKQAEKDYAEAGKHIVAQPLNAKHPFLRKKVDALKRAEQQIGFLIDELDKMTATINWKLQFSNQWEPTPRFRKHFDQMGFDDSGATEESLAFKILKKNLTLGARGLQNDFP